MAIASGAGPSIACFIVCFVLLRYLTVADGEGTMVSLIQSNYEGFGSGLVVPSLGFGLQDRGALFNMNASAANAYEPGKRPFHTIIPAFATRLDARTGAETPWMSFG